jgi:hypothetical protein
MQAASMEQSARSPTSGEILLSKLLGCGVQELVQGGVRGAAGRGARSAQWSWLAPRGDWTTLRLCPNPRLSIKMSADQSHISNMRRGTVSGCSIDKRRNRPQGRHPRSTRALRATAGKLSCTPHARARCARPLPPTRPAALLHLPSDPGARQHDKGQRRLLHGRHAVSGVVSGLAVRLNSLQAAGDACRRMPQPLASGRALGSSRDPVAR